MVKYIGGMMSHLVLITQGSVPRWVDKTGGKVM